MPRKAHTPAERALHLVGIMAGKSLREINDAVSRGEALTMTPEHRSNPLSQSEYDRIKSKHSTLSDVEAISMGLRGVSEGVEMWSDLWDHCLGTSH